MKKRFLLCFLISAVFMTVPAYASVSETLGINCRVCEKYTTWLLKEYVSYPTCTSSGTVRYSCSECGALVARAAPALGHDFQEIGRIEPACGASGISYQQCSRCAETRSETLPALAEDHAWTETDRANATCTESGSVFYECSFCHESKTESIPALDHDWTETSRTPATCTEEGAVDRTCIRCGFSVFEKIPALGTDHTWEEVNRTPPTETAPGLIEYTCSICGVSKTELIPILNPGGPASDFLPVLSSVMSVGVNWVSAVAGKIASNPTLLIIAVIGFIGTGAVWFKRLL